MNRLRTVQAAAQLKLPTTDPAAPYGSPRMALEVRRLYRSSALSELQILAMLPSDLPLRDIGSRLYVSRNTTKSHVANVYRKLGVTSRTAAIARARQLNLI